MSTRLNIEKKLNAEVNQFFRQFDKKRSVGYREMLGDKMLIISAIQAGMPYSLFDLIQLNFPFSDKDWAGFLDISTKSLQRYQSQPEYHFQSSQTEKIIEIAEVTEYGIDVFGDVEKFRHWLNTPNFALGSMVPLELLRNSYGKELVLAELTRINYGIFA